MIPSKLIVAAAIAFSTLFIGGCKDDHSGHDHGAETHESHEDHQHHEGDGHDHDKPAAGTDNASTTDKTREPQP